MTINPGDNVRLGDGHDAWHVWVVRDGMASIATLDGTLVRNAEPVERLTVIDRPNCRCHQSGVTR